MIEVRPNRHAGQVLAFVLLLTASRSANATDAPDIAAVLGEALEAALDITEPRVRTIVLLDTGEALAQARQFEAAGRAARGIEPSVWRCYVLATLAGEQAEAGDPASALRTLEGIDGPQSESPRSTALGRIALAQALADDLDGALETLRLDRNPASRYVLEAIAAARAEAGDIAGAIRAAESWDAPAKAWARNKVIAEVAAVQARHGDVAGAIRTVAEHGDGAAVGLAAIAAARLEAGDGEAAIAAARQALARGGDWQSEAAARVILVKSLVARGEIDEAKRVVAGHWHLPEPSGLGSQGILPSVDGHRKECLRAIARAQEGRGDVAAAIQTLEGVDLVYPRVQELAALATTLAEAGDAAGAERVLEHARRVAEERGGGFANWTVAVAYVRAGQLDLARDLFGRAMFAEHIGAVENRRVMVLEQARAGDLEGALQSAAAIPEPDLRDQALAWVAADLARRGLADDALDVAARIADSAVHATTLAHVSKALAVAGYQARALATSRKAADGLEAASPEAARIIAHAWASTPVGMPEALAWARDRETPEARAEALLGVTGGMAGRPIWVEVRSPFYVPRTK